MATVHRSTST